MILLFCYSITTEKEKLAFGEYKKISIGMKKESLVFSCFSDVIEKDRNKEWEVRRREREEVRKEKE